MKCIIFNIIFCSLLYSIQAQTIEGVVFDAKTKETITGVAIYLNGTSIITTSDSEGKFRLSVESKINASLVFSHLSYESLTIERPFELSENKFFLNEKVNTLTEVKVLADRYSRVEKMKAFKEQFLGKSEAGKSCVIINEDDIDLKYDSETNRLLASTRNPIIIENKYLAYRITFDLFSFSIQYRYTENTLDMAEILKVLYKGTSSFVDHSPYNVVFAKRREEIYTRSAPYFLHNLVSNTLDKAKFSISNRFRRVKTDDYFTILDVASYKTVLIKSGTNINTRHNSLLDEQVWGVIGILYNNKFNSEIVFLTDQFSVDEYGNPDAIDQIVFFGDMGDQRLGDMLPRDFSLPPTK